MQTSVDILTERRRIWTSKKILKKLYHKWYHIIRDALEPGNTLELGGGSGNLREFFPDAISSDILFAPWLDAVLDAHKLPFKEKSFDNIVLFDVLHHLMTPSLFFYEVDRILRQKGRIVIMEPYVSWASFLVYHFLHSEGMNWHDDPFKIDDSGKKTDPFYGNQAIPTLMFEKYRDQFIEKFHQFKVIREERMDYIVYPLSGGFHNPSLCPLCLYPILDYLEKLLRPFARFLAFRVLIVIEHSQKLK
jgi:SAM-dependent methyltransferase